MIFYYILIAIELIILFFAIYNFYKAFKIEKNLENYTFVITASFNYFFVTTFLSFILLIAVAFEVDYIADIRIFTILSFFFSLFLLSFSHLFYYLMAKRKLSDYEEFFKDFEIDLKNNCQKIMLKHILEKERNYEKVKKIFRINKHLCREKKENS